MVKYIKAFANKLEPIHLIVIVASGLIFASMWLGTQHGKTRENRVEGVNDTRLVCTAGVVVKDGKAVLDRNRHPIQCG